MASFSTAQTRRSDLPRTVTDNISSSTVRSVVLISLINALLFSAIELREISRFLRLIPVPQCVLFLSTAERVLLQSNQPLAPFFWLLSRNIPLANRLSNAIRWAASSTMLIITQTEQCSRAERKSKFEKLKTENTNKYF